MASIQTEADYYEAQLAKDRAARKAAMTDAKEHEINEHAAKIGFVERCLEKKVQEFAPDTQVTITNNEKSGGIEFKIEVNNLSNRDLGNKVYSGINSIFASKKISVRAGDNDKAGDLTLTITAPTLADIRQSLNSNAKGTVAQVKKEAENSAYRS